jgi:hypothetical protein
MKKIYNISGRLIAPLCFIKRKEISFSIKGKNS